MPYNFGIWAASIPRTNQFFLFFKCFSFGLWN